MLAIFFHRLPSWKCFDMFSDFTSSTFKIIDVCRNNCSQMSYFWLIWPFVVSFFCFRSSRRFAFFFFLTLNQLLFLSFGSRLCFHIWPSCGILPASPVVLVAGLLAVVMQLDCWPQVMNQQRWCWWARGRGAGIPQSADLQMLLFVWRCVWCEVWLFIIDITVDVHSWVCVCGCMLPILCTRESALWPLWLWGAQLGGRVSAFIPALRGHGPHRYPARGWKAVLQMSPAGVQRPSQQMSCLAAGTPLLSHQLLAEPFSKGC